MNDSSENTKTMRAIFIDAVNRKVEAVQIENELHTFYKKIGCVIVQSVAIHDALALLCDEEGRLRDWSMGFRVGQGPTIIAGNALIVGVDDNDDFTECRVPVSLIAPYIEFIDLKKNPLPPPKIGIAFIEEELNEENINRARLAAQRNLEEQE